MPLPEGFRLRPAELADLPRIAALREQVGWSVHDWALRAVVELPNARCLVVVDGDDAVVAVGSGIIYGRLGFVGNMVVDTAQRRRGLGAAILEAVTEHLESRGAHRLELYATADGRPLYRRHGFEATGSSTMARVPRDIPAVVRGLRLALAGPGDAPRLAAFDEPRFGGNRSTLLALMTEDPRRPLLVARRADEIVGFGWLRPDAERLGPLVADDPDVAQALIGEAFRRLPRAAAIGLNLPAGNEAGTARLRELGAELQAWDGRMARGPAIARRDETIYANAVGALG